jgi:hypothetical protein
MKISEYYRAAANLNLNGSIASLIPSALIVALNLSFFQNKEIMLLTIPFIIYSLISFQIYLFRKKQSILIGKNMLHSIQHFHSFFQSRQLLVVSLNTRIPRLLLFFPDGHLAGTIKRIRNKKTLIWKQSKTYVLADSEDCNIGHFEIKGNNKLRIAVYDQKGCYLGCYEKKKNAGMKYKKELLDETGRFVGAVEGSSLFMDEHVLDSSKRPVGYLRKGWMPLEWSGFFPEPNTPVLTFSEPLSEKDKLLRLSFLINEYFIKR